jgi:Ca2+-transporting ATPase
MGLLSNKPLLYSVLLTVGLQLAVIYTPWLNRLFRVSPLTPGELLAAFGLSSVVFFAVEAEKLARRRGLRRHLR